MAFDYATVARAIVAGLLVVFGLFLLARRPGTAALRIAGLAYVMTGGIRVHGNLAFARGAGAPSLAEAVGLALAETLELAAVAALAVVLVRPLPRRLKAILLAGAAFGTAVVLGPILGSLAYGCNTCTAQLALLAAVDLSDLAHAALWIGLVEATRRELQPAGRGWLLLVFCLVGSATASSFGSAGQSLVGALAARQSDLGTWSATVLACVHLAAMAWTARLLPLSPLGRNLLVGYQAWMAAGVLYAAAAPDYAGLPGVLPAVFRVASLGAACYALVAYDLLPTRLQVPTVRRGTLALVVLGGLSIGAQFAQGFLQNSFDGGTGLAVGAVVAGLLVVASLPVQAAAERALVRSRSAHGAEGKYREQVELAWQDGHIGTKERAMLRALQRQLGLTADQAATIEDGVVGTPR